MDVEDQITTRAGEKLIYPREHLVSTPDVHYAGIAYWY